MNEIVVIGIGPGNIDYLVPIALSKINKADILIGAKRCLSIIDCKDKDVFLISNNFNEMIDYMKKEYCKQKIVVLVTGDTGFYSMLRLLKRYFSYDELEVIPGISSIQYMFAKICELWDDAFTSSLHGKNIDFVKEVKKYKKVAMLTDKKWTPQKIACELLDKGIEDRVIYIGENLSYENENITRTNVIDLAKENKEYDICVVVIIDESHMEM